MLPDIGMPQQFSAYPLRNERMLGHRRKTKNILVIYSKLYTTT